MTLIRLAIALWVAFTAVWMYTQDIRIERLESRIKGQQGNDQKGENVCEETDHDK